MGQISIPAKVEEDVTSSSVHIGDLVFTYNDNTSLSGVNSSPIFQNYGSDGGFLKVFVIQSHGTLTTNEGCDIVHTGGPSVTRVKEAQITGHVDQGRQDGQFSANQGDVMILWDENSHGATDATWNYSGQFAVSQQLTTPLDGVYRWLTQFKESATFDVDSWGMETTLITLDLTYFQEPPEIEPAQKTVANLTATPKSTIANLIKWEYKEVYYEYEIEQNGTTQTIQPIEGFATVDDFYNYGSIGPCSNFPIDIVQDNISHAFLYKGPDGLSIVFVHDKAHSENTGGSAEFAITDFPVGGTWKVQDDPSELTNQDTSPSWAWGPTWEDGGAINGGLNGEFEMTVSPNFISGISDWKFVSDYPINRIDLDPTADLIIRATEKYGQRVSDPDTFAIFRKTPNRQYSLLTSVAGSQRSYLDEDVTTEREYTYQVKAAVPVKSEYSNNVIEAQVEIGDVVLAFDANATITGLSNQLIGNYGGVDGGYIKIFLIEESGTVTINTNVPKTIDVIHTGRADASSVSYDQTYSPENEGTGTVDTDIPQSGLIIQWDETASGATFQSDWSFNGSARELYSYDQGIVNRLVYQVFGKGDLTRDTTNSVELNVVSLEHSPTPGLENTYSDASDEDSARPDLIVGSSF